MMVLTLSGSKVDEITFFADPACPPASVFPNTVADKDGLDVKWRPPFSGHSGAPGPGERHAAGS